MLGLLPIQYKGVINFIKKKLNEIILNYPKFKNVIEFISLTLWLRLVQGPLHLNMEM